MGRVVETAQNCGPFCNGMGLCDNSSATDLLGQFAQLQKRRTRSNSSLSHCSIYNAGQSSSEIDNSSFRVFKKRCHLLRFMKIRIA